MEQPTADMGLSIPREEPFHSARAADNKAYQITGTNMSFSSHTPGEFDRKATEIVRQMEKRSDTVKMRNDLMKMEPQEIPAGDRVFLCEGTSFWSTILSRRPANGEWTNHGSVFGHGIWLPGSGYAALKRSFVYRNGNLKTNWIMDTYHVIDDYSIKSDGIVLCHVFESKGSYDPRPERVPTYLDYNQKALNSRVSELEALIKNPESFVDYDEFNENSGAYSTRIANSSNGKRSTAWDNFTEIKVLGPNGELVLTLAICHRCNIAYKTGGLKPKKKGSTELVFQNNGTKTMTEHNTKCCGQLC